MKKKYGHKINEPIIRVKHSDLKLWDSEVSAYRVCCPVCESGILLVARDSKTFNLIRADRCIVCGQSVHYTDDTIAGEKVFDGHALSN